MSFDPTMAVLYAQTGYTARVAHDAATGPQAAVAMSRLISEEVIKLEQQQVQGSQTIDESRVPKDGDQSGAGHHFGSRRRNRPPQPPPPEDDQPSTPHTPLVGNLLNLKV